MKSPKKNSDSEMLVRERASIARTSVDAANMTNGELVERVKGLFDKLAEHREYIVELRQRFGALPRGKANIDGCKTWTEFCNKVLHRTDRHIRRVIDDSSLEPSDEADIMSGSNEPLKVTGHTVTGSQLPTVIVTTRHVDIEVPVISYHDEKPKPVRVPRFRIKRQNKIIGHVDLTRDRNRDLRTLIHDLNLLGLHDKDHFPVNLQIKDGRIEIVQVGSTLGAVRE